MNVRLFIPAMIELREYDVVRDVRLLRDRSVDGIAISAIEVPVLEIRPWGGAPRLRRRPT